MVEFITGASGTGKTTLMFRRIKESDSAPEKKCIIVPEQYSYEFDKSLYFYLGASGFNELFSLSFTSLARQLFQLYGEPDRKGEYADDMAKMILIYQAVSSAQSQPGVLNYFKRKSSRSGFAEEVLKLITDLKRSGITPQLLAGRSVLFDRQLMDKTGDIAAIYYEYERLMEEYGFKDSLENIREAAKIAAFQQYFKGASVYLDEFESFTGDQTEMLKVIISYANNVYITLRTDDVYAGKYSVFETVNNTFRRLVELCSELNRPYKVTECRECYRFAAPELAYISTNISRNRRYEPEKAPEPSAVTIFEARDMYIEAEYVCAAIKRMIHDDKTLRYRDIAVISNTIEQYTDVLSAAFDRSRIPYFLSMEKSVSHTSLMVYFTTLLDLAGTGRFRTELILRLLKCGISGVSATDTALLENYCYKWGIDGALWEAPFTGEDETLETVENIRAAVIEPLRTLKRGLLGKKTAKEICGIIYRFLTDSGIDSNLAKLMEQLIHENLDYEASELKRLWGCLMEILDSTASTLRDTETDFRELSAIMRSMVSRLTYSVPPQTLDAVTAASARTARLSSPKVVFVMGACEGDFPNQVNLHGIFTEADKQQLLLKKIELSRPLSDLIASERLIVYKALSTASHRLILTYPQSDLSGQAKYPAQCIEQIRSMFGSRLKLLTDDMLTPDYYAVTMRSAYYHYMQDRKLNTSEIASLRRVLVSEPEYERRISAVLSRSGHKLSYSIDRKIMEKLRSFYPLKISPTALENYSKCHFMYFCSEFLKLHAPEKVELDIRMAGDISHDCFRRILGSRSKEEFISLTADNIISEVHESAERYCKEKLSGDFGKDARFDLIRSKLEEHLSGVFLHTQQELMSTSFVPAEFEMRISGKNAVRLPFGKNMTLCFEGIADRADLCTVGDRKYIRIIDYKSSKKRINAETLSQGVNMQMLLYLFAVSGKGAKYSGYIPSGVLYSPFFGEEPKAAESRAEAESAADRGSELRSSGLVISTPELLEAMEKGVSGKFVPVKYKTDGQLSSSSSCVTSEAMDKLRDFTFDTLTMMAESLLDGNADAIPMQGTNPCQYCQYGNICDNSDGTVTRQPEAERIELANEILNDKISRKEE